MVVFPFISRSTGPNWVLSKKHSRLFVFVKEGGRNPHAFGLCGGPSAKFCLRQCWLSLPLVMFERDMRNPVFEPGFDPGDPRNPGLAFENRTGIWVWLKIKQEGSRRFFFAIYPVMTGISRCPFASSTCGRAPTASAAWPQAFP